MILDEPTAALGQDETERLFLVVEQLRDAGLCAIYITHRIGEIRRIADTVSVLRNGAHVHTGRVEAVTDDGLVALMVGRKIESMFPTISTTPGKPALEVRKVTGDGVHDVSIAVRAGEVVGLAGLVGSGKDAVGRLIYGLSPVSSGDVYLTPGRRRKWSLFRRLRLGEGVMYYPADRKVDGLVGTLSVRENASLSALTQLTRWGMVDRRKEAARVDEILERLSLRPMRPEALPGTFSGGNQQKVVLARGLMGDYPIHVFDEPTAGVDVGARVEIYEFVRDIDEAGGAVLLISSDLPEVLNLCSRVYVVADGQIAAELSGDDLNEETVLPHFFHTLGDLQ